MKSAPAHAAAPPSWQTHSLTLAIASFKPNQKVPKHAHDNAFFCMALRGVCVEAYGRRMRTYEPLALSYLPAGELHSLEFYQAGMHSFSIEVAAQLFARARECSLQLGDSIHCRGGQLSLLFRKVYGEFRQLDDVDPPAIEGLVLGMLAYVSRRHA